MEGEEGEGEGAGEAVVVEIEGFEIGEVGEVGHGAGEGIELEAEDPELVEAGEGGVGKRAVEAEGLENQAGDAGGGRAGDAGPAAGGGGEGREEEAAGGVGGGLEGEEGGGVGAGEGLDGGGEAEEEEEEEKQCECERREARGVGHCSRREGEIGFKVSNSNLCRSLSLSLSHLTDSLSGSQALRLSASERECVSE